MVDASTEWVERIAQDEVARHAAAAEAFVAMQRAKSARFGQGRALHRKPLLALRATLTVPKGLPAAARQGLFAQVGEHDAWVRLSNGGPDVQSDRRPDVRGFSLRVWGADGPAALGGQTDHQDFALINLPAFAFADSVPFVSLVLAMAKGPAALLPWALRTYGPIGMLPALARLGRLFSRRFSGFATEPFFSATPIACGPYAARVRLLPPAGLQPAASQPQHWGDELLGRLAQGPLDYRLQLQFFVDEARTPIEDASVDWPEAVAPYVDVGVLRLLPPESGSAGEAFTTQVERSVFDPWQALMAHRPLGEVMRARKVVYFASQQERGVA
ncbi:catalase [Ideonella sp.]|uniref:catalase n=1 Tax=Ideonella sp. TaxID=1929293 RepID=UPI0035B266B3